MGGGALCLEDIVSLAHLPPLSPLRASPSILTPTLRVFPVICRLPLLTSHVTLPGIRSLQKSQ